jgi:hypothetical protein
METLCRGKEEGGREIFKENSEMNKNHIGLLSK